MSSVKLVSISKPVIEECETAEELIAYCARVSNPHNQANHDTSAKLLKYLVQHKHWSPFEMVHLTLEINCTRDIGRQILRHRSFSFQEFSQRYAEVEETSFELSGARLQDKHNRQNSLEVHDKALSDWWTLNQARNRDDAISLYQAALKKGIAKEVARKMLPEGITKSKIYMAGSLRSWIHYCELRMGPETQLEHRIVATDAWNVILGQFDSLTELLD